MHVGDDVRHLFLTAVLLAIAGCSPTTDITRTSTEPAAGRAPYDVVERQPSGDLLRVKVKIASLAAARTVAEDVAVRMRAPYDRVEVHVFGPDDRVQGRPSAILKWSTRDGFMWETR